MFRAVVIVSFLVSMTFAALAQNNFVCEKSILTEPNKSKKFSKEFLQWTEKQTMFEIVFNNKIDSIVAKGKFSFENTVTYPGSVTISRTYTGQTNGIITYYVVFVCKEDQYIVRLYDFEHKPTGKGDVICFGKVTKSDNPPDYIMMDYDSGWCLNVWKFIKDQCLTNASSFFLQMQNEIATNK